MSSAPAVSQREPKIWFVTHTRPAFGTELIRQILARGDIVVGVLTGMQNPPATHPSSHVRLINLRVDLTNPVDVQRSVDEVVERFGRIDYLINMAAEGLAGAVEETSDEEAQKVVDANLFAVLRVTRAVLGHMRTQRSGRIVHVVSLTRTQGQAGYGLYNAAKGALAALTESLAAEVKPFNISVSLVEPVPFAGDYAADSLRVTRRVIEDYYDTAGRIRRNPYTGYRVLGSDPVTGVQALLDAVTATKPPPHLIMGLEAFEKAIRRLDELKQALLGRRETSLAAEYIA